ncbi:hypothetical protein FQN50_002765 [Emmonsiellopsis sp. PD_5]|nr:hypothetical protein FQN50_002765 [Emmonsiellopsis sp. PD_5]
MTENAKDQAVVSPQQQSGNAIAQIARTFVQYAFYCMLERFHRRPATSATDIATSPKQMTAVWLTAILCSEHEGAAVESFEAEDVHKGTSSRLRISVTYNEAGRNAGLPTDLFAKTTHSFTQRFTLSLAGIITGEPTFFKHLRPGLDIEAPRGYHGAFDLGSGRSISVLENIAISKGATFFTPQSPVSRAQMEDLLANLAAMHGRYWNAPELDQHEHIKTPAKHYYNLDQLVRIEKRAQVGIERAQRVKNVIPDSVVEDQNNLYRALKQSLEVASQAPATLLHGDSHVGNTYQTSAGKMGFTDWQIIMKGSWAYDVAYTMGSGLAVEDRRSWEKELIAFYLERLDAAGGKAPDFESAFLAYRQQTIYPYMIWLATIGHSAIQPKYQPDEISCSIIERTAHAVMDHDPCAALKLAS